MQQIGRYEIIRELGRGAMGIVYSAVDPLIGRQVAIKTIRLDILQEDDNARAELTRRLFREAQSAGILSHPGIITIFDVGERVTDAYIVMEFVVGRTLEEILASGIPQHSEILFSILRQTAVALDYAHSKGIIHRDVKPANIMICNDGTVRVADFGVAKFAAAASMTQAGFVLGTPSYMSPEQAQGRDINGRSDQFSLAVVAFRMMTGKLPFHGPTLTALLTKILWEEPEYETAGLYPSLRPAFKRALSKNPELRFPACIDFIQELELGYSQHRAELQGKVAASAGSENSIPEPVQSQPVAQKPDSLPEPAAAVREIPLEPEPQPAPVAGPEEAPTVSATADSRAPEESGSCEKPKRKSLLHACAVTLGFAAIAVIAFAVFRMQPKVENAVQAPEQKPAPVTPVEPVKTNSAPEPGKTAAAEPAPVQASVPASVERDVKLRAGAIVWSGKLEKNSILVIGANTASVGSIQGDLLPGRPVRITVEPQTVTIRQSPDESNGWKQLMLYSGTEKYSSLTIHWEEVKH